MEAQAGKLFRTGKALRILLTVFNVVLVIGCVLTAAELLGYISRPFGEVAFIVEAVEHTVGSRVLLDIGSIAYVVCIIIVFTCCIRMTLKMSQDKYPFNAENVHLLRRMALVYIVAAAAALLFSTMNAVASGMGIGNVGFVSRDERGTADRHRPAAPVFGGRVRIRCGAAAALRRDPLKVI